MTIYAINADTLGIVEYADMAPSAIAEQAGVVYLVDGTGLHSLTGTTDNEAAINGYIQLGFVHFGTPQKKKKLSRFWYEGEASGGVNLTPISEEAGVRIEYPNYQIPAMIGSLGRSYLRLAQGPRSRWWALKVGNRNGGSFAPLDMQIEVVDLEMRF